MTLLKERWLPVTMGLFEVLFLLTTWRLGVAPNLDKLKIVLAYSVVVCALVVFLPTRLFAWSRGVEQYLSRDMGQWVLCLVLVVASVGLVYALNLGIVFDEGNILGESKIFAENDFRSFFAQYKSLPWAGRQHPPLILVVDGLAIRYLGESLFVLRMVSLVFTLGTVLLTLCIGTELYGKEIGQVAAVLLLSFTYIFRTGAAASVDIAVTFFFALTLYLFLHLRRSPSTALAILAGVSLGLGLLTKYTMMLLVPVLSVFLIVDGSFSNLRRYLILAGVVASGLFGVWLAYMFQTGLVFDQSRRIAFYARGTLFLLNGVKVMLEWVVARLPSAIGPYNIPAIALGVWQATRSRNRADQFLFLWIVLVFLILVLTLPDTRYFLPIFPALAIAMALGAKALPDVTGRVVSLALLLAGGSLYLFVDWHRTVTIFLR